MTREQLVGLYRSMLVARRLEEDRPHALQAGQDPGLLLHGPRQRGGLGGVAAAMQPEDVGMPLHRTSVSTSTADRSRGGSSPTTSGVPTALRRGRDGNVHFGELERGQIAIVSHLPAMLPVRSAARSPSASASEPRVAVGWFGDGSSARSDTHEAMNLAAVRGLPVVFVCDNNQWAYSTPTHLEYAATNSPTALTRTGSRAWPSTAPMCSRSTARRPRGRERSGRRRPDADRVGHAADGRPRRP